MNLGLFFITAASRRPGALGLYHVYGDEGALATTLDLRVRPPGKPHGVELCRGDLRYGWLVDGDDEMMDEVMLARPATGLRVLMTHGGSGIAHTVREFLTSRGFHELHDLDGELSPWQDCDDIIQPLLFAAHTQTQVAALLDEDYGDIGGKPPRISTDLLLTHRLLLAGPPNAGKSSLLNCLAGYSRAFVHHEPGATLDVVEELVDLGGYSVLVGDLPGYRIGINSVEGSAWDRAEKRLRLAEAILFVIDGNVSWNDYIAGSAAVIAKTITHAARVIVVLNKSDLKLSIYGEPWLEYFPQARVIQTNALPGGDAAEVIAREAGYLFAGRDNDAPETA